jgi:hypothetical protein
VSSIEGRRETMTTRRTSGPRANALGGELVTAVSTTSGAPAEAVYDLLADLRSHREWAGERQRRSTRLLSIEAPEGTAGVGTEFRTVGADPMGRFVDRSVVTEAIPPRVFEFVTEAHLETGKGREVDWTVVHRYELTTGDAGCRIAYTIRITRISELAGALRMFGIPGLRAIAVKASAGVARRGIGNLARLAEERTGGAAGR